MKSNLAAIFLVLVFLGLCIFLWNQNQSLAVHAKKVSETVVSQNDLVSNLQEKLDLQRLTNTILQTNLAAVQLKYSNDLAAAEERVYAASSNYDKAQADYRVAKDAVFAASAALAERDKRIHELEGQNTELDKESSLLRESITNLDAQMVAARKKLDASEGDKQLLLDELKRLQAQKDELERKLSDLASLKEQVAILRDNLSIARRIDWLRHGIYDAIGQKGAERLINPPPPSPPSTNKSLDVELHQNGGVRILSAPSTNAPSTNASPARAPSTR
jgi:chromosome segregation ATPase